MKLKTFLFLGAMTLGALSLNAQGGCPHDSTPSGGTSGTTEINHLQDNQVVRLLDKQLVHSFAVTIVIALHL